MTINQERFTTYKSLFPVLRTQTTSHEIKTVRKRCMQS